MSFFILNDLNNDYLVLNFQEMREIKKLMKELKPLDKKHVQLKAGTIFIQVNFKNQLSEIGLGRFTLFLIHSLIVG